jgi:hypothetical protein
LYRDLGELRAAKLAKPVTGEELRASAREAIPRVVEKKADQYRSGGEDITLLIITNGSLSAEEMAQLTEPWKNCFHTICLLRLLDVVMAWPELRVLSGEEPF